MFSPKTIHEHRHIMWIWLVRGRQSGEFLFWANEIGEKEYILTSLINNTEDEWKMQKNTHMKKQESKKKTHAVHKLPMLTKKCH